VRVVLVHDWLTGMRGGERVLERLCAMFPGAPIHTLLWNRGTVSSRIEAHEIHTSILQRLPGVRRHYRWFLPLFPRAIRSLRVGECDVVISLSHCAAKAIRVPARAFHLSYVFTPMRYVWELEDQYFPPGRFPWPASGYVRRTCARLRTWDVATSRGPQAMVAISRHVAARIARHYGRDAQVIYPPVELRRFTADTGDRDGYLLAGAFAPYKRADLAIEACRRLGRRLTVVGTGQDEPRLRELAGSNAEFLGWVSDDRMAELYRRARALIFPGEEDFGIVPLEALASGCPVIALGRGGAVETVGRGAPAPDLSRVAEGGMAAVPGGVLFGTQSVEALCEAIRESERHCFAPETLRRLAEPFDAARFDQEFRSVLEREYAGWRAGAARAVHS